VELPVEVVDGRRDGGVAHHGVCKNAVQRRGAASVGTATDVVVACLRIGESQRSGCDGVDQCRSAVGKVVIGSQSEETLLRTVELESLRARETEIGQVDPVSVGEHVGEVQVEMGHARRTHVPHRPE